jgi:hypothetical protein
VDFQDLFYLRAAAAAAADDDDEDDDDDDDDNDDAAAVKKLLSVTNTQRFAQNLNPPRVVMAQHASPTSEPPARHFRFSVDRGGTFTDM